MTARRTATAIAVSAVISASVGLAHPARALAAPQRAEVHYASTFVDVRWSAVADATSYAVEVSKDGYYGPWRRWGTSSAVTKLAVKPWPAFIAVIFLLIVSATRREVSTTAASRMLTEPPPVHWTTMEKLLGRHDAIALEDHAVLHHKRNVA